MMICALPRTEIARKRDVMRALCCFDLLQSWLFTISFGSRSSESFAGAREGRCVTQIAHHEVSLQVMALMIRRWVLFLELRTYQDLLASSLEWRLTSGAAEFAWPRLQRSRCSEQSCRRFQLFPQFVL
jgi:hypothetical protein